MLIEELKAIQHKHGYLPREELYALSERTNVPLWQIHGVASFYPHFRLQPPLKVEVKVCADVSCHLRDACLLSRQVAAEVQQLGLESVAVKEVSCLGRCDGAPAASINGEIYTDVTAAKLRPLLLAAAEGKPVRRQRRHAHPVTLVINPYDDAPPYSTLRWLMESNGFDGVIPALKDSGLRGMGGAGFPTGVKWEIVRNAPTRPHPLDPEPHVRKYVICNADESEPGTFKDREILRALPHLVLEGMLIAMHTVGAQKGIVFIRHEYYREREILERELRRVKALGSKVSVTPATLQPQPFTLDVFESPGGYICGEETALLEVLEDKRAEPRNKPPFPGTHGLWGKPTLINNVETFAWVPAILVRGAGWFKAQGLNGAAGLKFFALSGHVRQPGVYEVPLGIPACELIFRYGGGIMKRKRLKAFSPGGASSGFLPASMADVPLEFRALAQVGSMLGSGAVVAIAEGTCMLDLALNVVRFFRNESCGKCVPCREGSQQIVNLLQNIQRGAGKREDLDLIADIAEAMQLTSICGLGQAAPLPILSVIRHFKEEIDAHVLRGECPTGVCGR
ncbi:MAG: NAD(P)H-dependent oxidoreductase subunit E [Abditibacteriales bacterium]|nr:NAD(P)H-dependent oxidoreductase subunit E [Abditibacteriales bacterium]MDW8367144.1 NADH-ubiquinone oxidoreductase-F iron-sulfur binding region domain-containing protein [Abditibacteriales bacterium]